MAFKRQIDRLPIIPADATNRNVTCHFCIVGCGYHAYSWPVNKQGGTDPAQNIFKTDLSKQQVPENRGLVCALDVQHREAERAGRAHRHQARQGL